MLPKNPPTQPVQSDPPRFGIFVILDLPGLLAIGHSAVVFAALLRKTLSAPLLERGILLKKSVGGDTGFIEIGAATVGSDGCRVFGLFVVSHLNHGLTAIKDELASLDALPYAKIGWMNSVGQWQGLWPHESREPFEEAYASFFQEPARPNRTPQ